jgi:energy-coupling factor transport system permease protein
MTGNMFIHRLDPRVKLYAAVTLTLQVLLSVTPMALISAGVLVVAGFVISGVPASHFLGRLRTVLWFCFFIFIVNALTVSGEVLLEGAGLFVTREGMITGAILSTRIVLLLWISTLLISTTPVPDILDTFEFMLRPVRRTLGSFVAVLGITLNFIPLLIRTARQIKTAQVARGADVDSTIVKQVRFAASAAFPLFALALRSSDNLALAMESRCYSPTIDRTPYSNLKFNSVDWVTALSMTVIFVAVLLFAG